MFKEKYDALNSAWSEVCKKYGLPPTDVGVGMKMQEAGTTSLEMGFDQLTGLLNVDEDILKKESLEELIAYLPHECMHYEQWKAGFSNLIFNPPIVAPNKIWLDYNSDKALELAVMSGRLIRYSILEYDANKRLVKHGQFIDYLKLNPVPEIHPLVKSQVGLFYRSKKETPKESMLSYSWYVNFFCDCFRLYKPCQTEEEKALATNVISKAWSFVDKKDVEYALSLVNELEPDELEISRTLRSLFNSNWNIRKKLPFKDLKATWNFMSFTSIQK